MLPTSTGSVAHRPSPARPVWITQPSRKRNSIRAVPMAQRACMRILMSSGAQPEKPSVAGELANRDRLLMNVVFLQYSTYSPIVEILQQSSFGAIVAI